ncbi:MAG: excinuclease ABC subunit UvrA, partial [Candidatus Moranbacteria bacterium]|nr:excinuclease ABC subunit UvrA [Candidatus Moranbacteria bacterium]
VFDVVYAESNRRFMESLSSYARALIGVATKPDVKKIENLSPAIAIDQKSVGRSVRSTVGTMTEIYDYLRILFSIAGTPHCPETGIPLSRKSPMDVVNEILQTKVNEKIIILAPCFSKDKKNSEILNLISKKGFARVRYDGKIMFLSQAQLIVDDNVNVDIEAVVDKFIFSGDDEDREYIFDSVDTAMKVSSGSCIIIYEKKQVEKLYSREFYCRESDFHFPELGSQNFSFNHPEGACDTCDGIGKQKKFDPELLVPNNKLSILEGAIHCWTKFNHQSNSNHDKIVLLKSLGRKYKFSVNQPINKFSKKQLKVIFYGTEDLITVQGEKKNFRGVISDLEKKYSNTKSDHMRMDLEKYMNKHTCSTCEGKKLKREYLSVLIDKKSIDDYVQMSLDDFNNEIIKLNNLDWSNATKKDAVGQLVDEMSMRSQILCNVGLGYLSLSRTSNTLSGGEAQRIRLSVQIKSDLTGVIYVLDEPTIGLHSRDTFKLIKTMKKLQQAGNTLLVVEHDADVIKSADHIIDMGEGAGELGGNLIFDGDFKKLKNSNTLTSQYIRGKKKVYNKKKSRKGNGKFISINGATENNLKNISIKFPLESFNVVVGVSGSGKSTLVNNILARALSKHFYRAKANSGAHKSITGLANLKKVINITQAPIGKTPRSNAATYTGIFSHIRELFAEIGQAQEHGYTARHFSFNMKGGRCEVCHGDGVTKVEMHLLPDVYVECETCKGSRYSSKILDIEYCGENISNVLNMSVGYALEFFKNQPLIADKLQIMKDVGLDYLKLGQSATNLSGGEAQRIKLATELARKSVGQTLYILDEPTVGLHFEDTRKLLHVLERLVDKGNTVLVVEHNLDVIRQADWVIELGPDGGDGGGEIVFEGTPDKLKKCKKSLTAKFL